MGMRRGLVSSVSALALVAGVAAGCGVGCDGKNPPIRLTWSEKVVLSADSPAAARVINVDIPSTEGLLVTYLDFNWTEEPGTTIEDPWISIVDVTGGTSTYMSPWDGAGSASLTDACRYGCNRTYAYIFRWDNPALGESRTIGARATLRISSAGGADACEGVVGTLDARLTEDVSQRFDGKPRTLSARTTGDLKVPWDGANVSASAHLHASKALMEQRVKYPAVARVFVGFTPDSSHEGAALTLGSKLALTDGGVPTQAGWQQLCDLDEDCELPIQFSGQVGVAFAPSGASGVSTRTVQWWAEARMELFSATGSLPSGTLTLTAP